MALKADKNLKLYYSIGEVAQMLNVSESLLRFWEKEFPNIAPKRAGRDVRQYTQADIELLRKIHFLVKERGMKLAAARKALQSGAEKINRDAELAERLKTVRDKLEGLKHALDALQKESTDGENRNC